MVVPDLESDLQNRSGVPVSIMPARNKEHDKISTLATGTDDYPEKPFNTGEWFVRVRTNCDAGNDSKTILIRFADVYIDPRTPSGRTNGDGHLTPMEYRIRTCLASRPDRVFTCRLRKSGHTEDMHYIRVHTANLRKNQKERFHTKASRHGSRDQRPVCPGFNNRMNLQIKP